MATNERRPIQTDSSPEPPDDGPVIAHPTVVPTNFDADEPNGRRD